MRISRRHIAALLAVAVSWSGPGGLGVPANVLAGAPPPVTQTTLPQDQPYEKVLHAYMATLTAKDFDHGVSGSPEGKPSSTDPDEEYRNYIFTLQPQPLVGTKRGEPAVNAPPALFTLEKIEAPQGVLRPPGYSEATVSFLQWNYPGNPFYDNRALKMRAFIGSAINLMMLDDYVEKNPLLLRTDRLPYYLVRCGAAYPAVKDLLPPDVRKAYQDGLRRLAECILAVKPKGEEPNLDMMAPVGLSYAARAIEDPAFTKRVEDWCRPMFADPQYLDPAGYWVERGGLDINFSGTTNYFAIWAALMNDWPFANEALDKVYRLRAHLVLPEPTGKGTGPSEFNTRTGGAAIGDQWDYANRDRGAAMLTDEAACFVTLPTAEQLAGAGKARAEAFSSALHENPRAVAGQNIFQTNDQIGSNLWGYSILPNYNFPASVNPANEFYRKGSLARLQKLVDKHSPLLKLPVERGETFVRDFNKRFVVVREKGFAAIVHCGPVAEQDANDGKFQFNAPFGFGGGELAAFWTPATGSILLGRRAGQYWDKPFDVVKAWRNWPIHAVSGETAEGVFFTSARIARPDTTVEVDGKEAQISVKGVIPASVTGQQGAIAGRYEYVRSFKIDGKGVKVETKIAGDGKDSIAQLVETLPVLLVDPGAEAADQPKTRIELLTGGAWQPATEAYTPGVDAVRVTRFSGAVEIRFDKARRVKLSPDEFHDKYVTTASCRTVMVDLLESGDKPAALKDARTLSYRIEPMTN